MVEEAADGLAGDGVGVGVGDALGLGDVLLEAGEVAEELVDGGDDLESAVGVGEMGIESDAVEGLGVVHGSADLCSDCLIDSFQQQLVARLGVQWLSTDILHAYCLESRLAFVADVVTLLQLFKTIGYICLPVPLQPVSFLLGLYGETYEVPPQQIKMRHTSRREQFLSCLSRLQ